MGRRRKTSSPAQRRHSKYAAKESVKIRHAKHSLPHATALTCEYDSDYDSDDLSQSNSVHSDSEDDTSVLVYERTDHDENNNDLYSSTAENPSSTQLSSLNVDITTAFNAIDLPGIVAEESSGSSPPTDSATLSAQSLPQTQSRTRKSHKNTDKPKQTYFEHGQLRISQLQKQENVDAFLMNKDKKQPTTANNIDNMLPINDLRSYSYPLQTAMVESGYWEHLKRQIRSCLVATDDFSERSSILPNTIAQPLSTASRRKLLLTTSALASFMAELEKNHKQQKSSSLKRVAQAVCRYRDDISWKTLLKRYKDFINDYGTLEGVRNKSRSPYSLIEDESARDIMRAFMDRACRAKPPATAADFRAFILSMFLCNISIRCAQVWLYKLGYRYRRVDAKELYNDGHNREDVKKALAEYISTMKLLTRKQRSYYGLEMNDIIEPSITLPDEKRVIFNFHDEVSTHSKDSLSRSYRRHGSTGKMQSKSRGEQGHASTWVSEEGIDFEALQIITPGMKEGKDDYWDGEDLMKQVPIHLQAFFDRHKHTADAIDIYDNSSGHGCLPCNALVVTGKVNKFCGFARKNPLRIRDTYYIKANDPNQQPIEQSFYFCVGDTILQKDITEKYSLRNGVCASKCYPTGYVITSDDHELIGTAKGAVQVLLERGINVDLCTCEKTKLRNKLNEQRKECWEEWNEDKQNEIKLLALMSLPDKDEVTNMVSQTPCNCALCTLSTQPDFLSQKSGLEEIYDKFNTDNGTAYQCLFLPKFHPELNPIERCWGRMKYHIRRFSDGKLSTLIRLMREGLDPNINLPLSMIRRFIRLSFAYLIAYDKGLDVLQTEAWLRKQRKHRSYDEKIDDVLNALYFPKDNLAVPWWKVSESENNGASGSVLSGDSSNSNNTGTAVPMEIVGDDFDTNNTVNGNEHNIDSNESSNSFMVSDVVSSFVASAAATTANITAADDDERLLSNDNNDVNTSGNMDVINNNEEGGHNGWADFLLEDQTLGQEQDDLLMNSGDNIRREEPHCKQDEDQVAIDFITSCFKDDF